MTIGERSYRQMAQMLLLRSPLAGLAINILDLEIKTNHSKLKSITTRKRGKRNPVFFYNSNQRFITAYFRHFRFLEPCVCACAHNKTQRWLNVRGPSAVWRGARKDASILVHLSLSPVRWSTDLSILLLLQFVNKWRLLPFLRVLVRRVIK